MIFYRVLIKITQPNGRQWIEINSYKNLAYARETAKRYVNCILNAASHSNGCYMLRLPFNNMTGYFKNDELVQVVIEKAEKNNVIFEYVPGLWSTESIL